MRAGGDLVNGSHARRPAELGEAEQVAASVLDKRTDRIDSDCGGERRDRGDDAGSGRDLVSGRKIAGSAVRRGSEQVAAGVFHESERTAAVGSVEGGECRYGVAARHDLENGSFVESAAAGRRAEKISAAVLDQGTRIGAVRTIECLRGDDGGPARQDFEHGSHAELTAAGSDSEQVAALVDDHAVERHRSVRGDEGSDGRDRGRTGRHLEYGSLVRRTPFFRRSEDISAAVLDQSAEYRRSGRGAQKGDGTAGRCRRSGDHASVAVEVQAGGKGAARDGERDRWGSRRRNDLVIGSSDQPVRKRRRRDRRRNDTEFQRFERESTPLPLRPCPSRFTRGRR